MTAVLDTLPLPLMLVIAFLMLGHRSAIGWLNAAVRWEEWRKARAARLLSPSSAGRLRKITVRRPTLPPSASREGPGATRAGRRAEVP